MAGSSANWWRPTGGPLANQAVYLSKTQQGGRSRAQIQADLNRGTSAVLTQANTQRPAGAAKPGVAAPQASTNDPTNRIRPAAQTQAQTGNPLAQATARYAQQRQANLGLPRVKNGAFGDYAAVQRGQRDYVVINTNTGDIHTDRNTSSFKTSAGAVGLAKKADSQAKARQQRKAQAQGTGKKSVGMTEYTRRQTLERQARTRRDQIAQDYNMLRYGMPTTTGYTAGHLRSMERPLTSAQRARLRQLDRAQTQAEKQWQRRLQTLNSIQP
jgi:hypothetical protein